LRFANTAKEQKIHEIWDAGRIIKKLIVKRFDLESEAYRFEKTEIVRIGYNNLTNVSGGVVLEIDRSIHKARRFIVDMRIKSSRLKGHASILADALADEMQQNLDVFLSSHVVAK
jgi:hypothetical protein